MTTYVLWNFIKTPPKNQLQILHVFITKADIDEWKIPISSINHHNKWTPNWPHWIYNYYLPIKNSFIVLSIDTHKWREEKFFIFFVLWFYRELKVKKACRCLNYLFIHAQDTSFAWRIFPWRPEIFQEYLKEINA